MRAALVIALCMTGCFSDRGVAIEIDTSGTEAISVELYIGKVSCDSQDPHCKTITPPGATCALQDDSWFRDDAQRYIEPVHGHTATFRLESTTANPLPIVIAVGSNAAGAAVATATLYELVVPVDSGRIVKATLIDAQPLVTTQPAPQNLDQDRVQVWTNKQTSCVVVEHLRSGSDPKRDSIVPPDDPDCSDGKNEGGIATRTYCTSASVTTGACTLGVRTLHAGQRGCGL